jgi:hypothetical protein
MDLQPFYSPLLAAGLDWLEGLLPLLFVVIWIASQVLNLFRGGRRGEAVKPPANPQAERRPGPVPRAPQPVRPAAGGAPNGDLALDREIEAFLRRTLQRDQQTDVVELPAPSRPRRNGGKPPRRRSRSQAEAVTVPPLPATPRSSAKGEDIASHVEHAFAHDLAHASPTTIDSRPPQVADSSAAALMAAIQSPGGLRQLVLMHEVLERPTHRW